MNPVVLLLAIGAVYALIWIAISLHVLAAHAYEIVCILGSHKAAPLPDSDTGGKP